VDEIGINPAAIHALWTLKGLDLEMASVGKEVVSGALKHPCSGVRKTIVQVMPRSQEAASTLLQADMLNDKEPLVVLNTLLALSEMPQSPASQKAILARLDKSTEVNDRWLPEAFAVVLNSNNRQLMKAYLKQVTMNGASQPKAGQPAHDMSQHNPSQTGKQSTSTSTIRSAATTADAQSGEAQSFNKDATQPDLLVAAVRTTPESPAVREGARIFVDVKNAGGVAIPDGTPIPLTVQIEGPAGVPDKAKINYVSVKHTTGIKPGETVTISSGNNGPWNADFGVNFERAGKYMITVMLDRENKIAESNEQNNNATHTLTYQPPQSLSAYVLERATRSYASTAPVDSIVILLRQTQKLDAAQSAAIVKGVAEGWNMRQKGTVREDDKVFLASLSSSVTPDNRERLGRLYEAWGLTKQEPVDPTVEIIRMKTIREEMRFDKKEFTVTAGKPIEIVLENPDAMQHNLVIGKPKSMDIIGAAADKMITAKDGAEKNYVPNLTQIIAATPLVNPDQTYRLKFTAPAQPGDYPFVCTFPGHWRIMNGVMKVTKASEAMNAK
jgi:azurin